MAPQKTAALLLHSMPYAETSAILRLYTQQFGMIHCMAKGARSRSKGHVPLERGSLIETMIYIKPGRSLQTIGAHSVLEFYPAIRADIHLSTMRDTAFEMAMKALHSEDPNPELYTFFVRFLEHLEHARPERSYPYALWRFFTAFAGHLGFAPQLSRCALCSTPLNTTDTVTMSATYGGAVCTCCVPGDRGATGLNASVRAYLSAPAGSAAATPMVPPANQSAITRILADYCRHHIEWQGEYRSLDFVCELLDGR